MDSTRPVRFADDVSIPAIVIATPDITAIINGMARATMALGNCPTCRMPSYIPCITSGIDGAHSRTSQHYRAGALDFRSRDWPLGSRDSIMRALSKELEPHYRCRLETDHLHIERSL